LETGWGTSNYSCDKTTLACTRTGWLYGAGGGVSQIFAEPSYQKDAGLSFSGRAIPDVAALADPQTGLLVGETQTFPDGTYYDEYRIGGTSLASPIFAGLMALADQAAGTPARLREPGLLRESQLVLRRAVAKTAVARRELQQRRRRKRGHF
jgi:subtilase family serine protease